jgi:hypothetical protein
MKPFLLAALIAATPSFHSAAADLPNWAAKLAATVSSAKEHCSHDYVVRTKVAARFLASIHPRVDPDDPEVKTARDTHRARLDEYFKGMSRLEVCSRLHGVLGPDSRIIRDNHLKPIMVSKDAGND